MADPHPIIAKLLAALAMALIAAIALGFATAEPADDQLLRHYDRPTDDPLWPEHLRCLVLGAEAADDWICVVLLAAEREG